MKEVRRMRWERRIAVSVLIIILIILLRRIPFGGEPSQLTISRLDAPYYVVYYASALMYF